MVCLNGVYCCGPSLVNGIDDEEQQAWLSCSLNCCESGYRARHRLRSKTTETSVNHGAAHFTIRRFGSRGALCKDGLCRGYIKRGRKTHVRQDNATLRRCVKLCTFNQEETITVVIMTVGSRSTWISNVHSQLPVQHTRRKATLESTPKKIKLPSDDPPLARGKMSG